MDMIKIGKFIARLRKEQGLTQEQLGEKIGVTNKTVSRWEMGSYLPPADALLNMSVLFGVSVNELLSGQHLKDEEYRQAAEENLTQAIKSNSFALKDKIDFFKKKWLKDHIVIMVFLGVCIIGVFVGGILFKNVPVCYGAFLFFVAAHCWRNNTMMTYVEKNAYDGTGNIVNSICREVEKRDK